MNTADLAAPLPPELVAQEARVRRAEQDVDGQLVLLTGVGVVQVQLDVDRAGRPAAQPDPRQRPARRHAGPRHERRPAPLPAQHQPPRGRLPYPGAAPAPAGALIGRPPSPAGGGSGWGRSRSHRNKSPRLICPMCLCGARDQAAAPVVCAMCAPRVRHDAKPSRCPRRWAEANTLCPSARTFHPGLARALLMHAHQNTRRFISGRHPLRGCGGPFLATGGHT